MKNLFYYLLPAIMIFAIQSCTTDPIDDIEPTLVFVAGATYISADATIPAGSEITVKIKTQKGTNDLSLLTVNQKRTGEAETIVDPATFKIGGIIDQNPKSILAAADKVGFEYEISFPSSAIGEDITYTFTIKDSKNIATSQSIVITTLGVKTITAAKLYNKQGPTGKGGLDLHSGASTGSMDASAELIDLGNNADLTYKAQFEPRTNETVVKATVDAWETLNSDASIQAAFDSGNNIGSIITPAKGNVYVIRSGIFYFAIKITNIVDEANTNTFANDYIEMDIKQKN